MVKGWAPPPCPTCKGATQERAERNPQPTDPPFWTRLKFWFDCIPCATSWECCGICRRGTLVEGALWGEPDIQQVTCKGGCGWAVAWRPKNSTSRRVPDLLAERDANFVAPTQRRTGIESGRVEFL